jgi:DNA-binding transcriptional LysR family regulator
LWRLGSFTRAATTLHLTQPAVTRQIAALEGELGALLFDRMGRTIRLSAAGEVLLPRAEALLQSAEEARRAVAEVAGGTAGKLTVAASSTLAAYVVPRLLRAFQAAHPGVELALRTGLSAQVRELVRSGAADVGLATTEGELTPHDDSGPLAVHRLGRYETALVVPPDHRLARQTQVAPTDLSGEPLLAMEPGTNLRAFVDRLLALSGVEAKITMELDSVEAIKRMVEAGIGVALLPRVAADTEAEAGRLVALPLSGVPLPDREIVLLWRKDRQKSTILQAALDAVVGGFPR